MDVMERRCYNSYLEINLDKIKRNVEKIRAYTGNEVLPVIKSNAYGLGTAAIADFLVRHCGIRFIGVARVFEACQILNAGCRPDDILVIGPVPSFTIPVAVEKGLQIPLFRKEDVLRFSEEAERQGKGTVKAHIKIETGMNRIGVRPGEELEELIAYIRERGNIIIDGVFTHFATADRANAGKGNDYTRLQFERFKEALEQIRAAGVTPRFIHCCNTGGATWLKEAREVSTHVRVGSLYLGYSSVQDDWNPIGVEESASWRTYIVNKRHLEPGESCGYGRAFMPDRPADVAVIGIGYGDGYLRHFAVQGAPVIIGGKRCPFVSIAMDMAFVDVTGVDCEVGDEVTLFGTDGKGNRLGGLELGHMLGETRLAMFTHISERVARVYLTNEKEDKT